MKYCLLYVMPAATKLPYKFYMRVTYQIPHSNQLKKRTTDNVGRWVTAFSHLVSNLSIWSCSHLKASLPDLRNLLFSANEDCHLFILSLDIDVVIVNFLL